MAQVGLVKHNVNIYLRRMFDRLSTQVYIFRRLDDGRMQNFELEPTPHGPILKATEFKPSSEYMSLDDLEIKPFVIMDEPTLREFISAMVRLGDEEGLPRPSEDHLKGKLEATEKHLEDMRVIALGPLSVKYKEPGMSGLKLKDIIRANEG